MTFIFSSCNKETNSTQETETIQVGGLFSLTGNWSSLGATSQAAMKIATDDINLYLESIHSKYRFSSVVFDTKLDTGMAKSELIKAFSDNQIRYIIGPQSSAEVAAIRDYANSNNILIVSQGSTASSLALPNDAIFRFCPGDAVEGAAMANSIYSAGKTKLITICRDDAGNKGLQTNVASNFTQKGGSVDAIAPYATNTTDFTVVLNDLKSKLNTLLLNTDSSKIAVYIAAFDECKDLFEQASNDPIFAKVNWYGGDGIVLSSAVTGSNKAAGFANKVGFFAPNYGLPAVAHPDLKSVVDAIKAKTSLDVDAYGLAVYDAMWVIAKSITENPNTINNFSAFKSTFTNTSNQFNGLTGNLSLNANGDRNSGTFDYYGIVWENNAFVWKLVGKSI